MKEGELCGHCKKAKLEAMKGDGVFNTDFVQCPNCDSTYHVDSPTIEIGGKKFEMYGRNAKKVN